MARNADSRDGYVIDVEINHINLHVQSAGFYSTSFWQLS